MPTLKVRILVDIPLRPILHEDTDRPIPSHERQVSIRNFVPDEPRTPVQRLVQHGSDPLGFGDVAFLCRRQRLVVEQVFLGSGGVTDFVLCVILVDQVCNDGAGFPEGDIGVQVVDCRHSPIWIDGFEFGLLQIGIFDELSNVWKLKLFKINDDLEVL
jgi:hypothetical protein